MTGMASRLRTGGTRLQQNARVLAAYVASSPFRSPGLLGDVRDSLLSGFTAQGE